jgi:hypothetical protein
MRPLWLWEKVASHQTRNVTELSFCSLGRRRLNDIPRDGFFYPCSATGLRRLGFKENRDLSIGYQVVTSRHGAFHMIDKTVTGR